MILTALSRLEERGDRLSVLPCQALGQLSRLGDQPAVAREAGELQGAQTRLACAEKLSLPAQLQVNLGERKAVVRVDERLQAPLCILGELLLGPRDEETVGLLGAAADAPAQLVQLGKAEAVGLLDDHDRRVRDVDADLDHRSGDKD